MENKTSEKEKTAELEAITTRNKIAGFVDGISRRIIR